MVSRTLLGMEPPTPDRIVTVGGKLTAAEGASPLAGAAKSGQ